MPMTPTLQKILWPDAALCPAGDSSLFLRLEGGASVEENSVRLPDGGAVVTDTYFNLFSLGKWQNRCALEQLHLEVLGEGSVTVQVFKTTPGGTDTVVEAALELDPATSRRLDLSGPLGLPEATSGPAVLGLRITAQGAARLTAADWRTDQPPLRRPELALAITTFRREDAVRDAVARFRTFRTQAEQGAHMHLIVVDNGQSAGLHPSADVTPVDNPNLGGAGGFARAILEARARGASHCLFMDDDASVQAGCHERVCAFLAYACDPDTAIAGAMLPEHDPEHLWENGAVFYERCRPQYMGTDLRDAAEVAALDFDTTAPLPAHFYGGWWYFAFPLAPVHHLPFPFFVRGDDVSFSLAHGFNMLTLSGVASVQSSFPDKESPLTWYLDLRSHMAHHLSLPQMEIGRLRVMKIAIWFHLRNIIRCHYDTLAALNLAFEDVLRGPEGFARDPAAEARRAAIRELTVQEAWQPGAPPHEAVTRIDVSGGLRRLGMKLSLNGHLLPFFASLGNRIHLAVHRRGEVRPLWGAAELTYVDRAGNRHYTVRHSKRRMWRETAPLLANCLRLLWRYPQLVKAWRDSYPELTSEEYWRRVLSRTTPGK